MKTTLYKISETYYLQKQNGELMRIARNSARHFLTNFSDAEYCESSDLAPAVMKDYDGDIIAELVEGNYLLVKNARLFRELIENSEVTFVSVKQYAQLHGKGAAMIRRYCQNNKIEGAISTPGGYLIPEDAPYPRK